MWRRVLAAAGLGLAIAVVPVSPALATQVTCAPGTGLAGWVYDNVDVAFPANTDLPYPASQPPSGTWYYMVYGAPGQFCSLAYQAYTGRASTGATQQSSTPVRVASSGFYVVRYGTAVAVGTPPAPVFGPPTSPSPAPSPAASPPPSCDPWLGMVPAPSPATGCSIRGVVPSSAPSSTASAASVVAAAFCPAPVASSSPTSTPTPGPTSSASPTGGDGCYVTASIDTPQYLVLCLFAGLLLMLGLVGFVRRESVGLSRVE